MKKASLIIVLFFGFAHSQSSSGSYASSKPISTNISETISDIERNDFRYREEKRKAKRNKKMYHTQGERILIYGGENNEVFLGCLNCDKYDKESIWDFNNEYGSSFGKYSIWNKFKDYGGENGNYSPFNKFGNNAPKLVDAKGNFYGYFTVDKYFKDRSILKLSDYIANNWEVISEDTITAYSEIFE